jgi:hypothetical protein
LSELHAVILLLEIADQVHARSGISGLQSTCQFYPRHCHRVEGWHHRDLVVSFFAHLEEFRDTFGPSEQLADTFSGLRIEGCQ